MPSSAMEVWRSRTSVVWFGFALGELLADADDGDEAVGERGLELEVDALVGLVEVLAAFAVADEDVGDAEGLEHERRGLAGVGALVEPVHVLRADVDGVVACARRRRWAAAWARRRGRSRHACGERRAG